MQSHKGGKLGWVGAIGILRDSDLMATGGSDGVVRLWQVSDESGIEPICEIPVEVYLLFPYIERSLMCIIYYRDSLMVLSLLVRILW